MRFRGVAAKTSYLTLEVEADSYEQAEERLNHAACEAKEYKWLEDQGPIALYDLEPVDDDEDVVIFSLDFVELENLRS